jgi:hypothetical protein
MEIVPLVARPGVTEGLGNKSGSVQPLFGARRFVPLSIGDARGWLLRSGFYGSVPTFVTFVTYPRNLFSYPTCYTFVTLVCNNMSIIIGPESPSYSLRSFFLLPDTWRAPLTSAKPRS